MHWAARARSRAPEKAGMSNAAKIARAAIIISNILNDQRFFSPMSVSLHSSNPNFMRTSRWCSVLRAGRGSPSSLRFSGAVRAFSASASCSCLSSRCRLVPPALFRNGLLLERRRMRLDLLHGVVIEELLATIGTLMKLQAGDAVALTIKLIAPVSLDPLNLATAAGRAL